MAANREGQGSTKLVIGIWPLITLTAVIFGFFFMTILGHAERITKNETNIQNIMTMVCKIDKNVEIIKERGE